MKKYKKIFLEQKTKKSFALHHLCPVHEVTTGIWSPSVAAVTSGLLTIVKTGITIVSYFGNVTASLSALTIVRKFTPR